MSRVGRFFERGLVTLIAMCQSIPPVWRYVTRVILCITQSCLNQCWPASSPSWSVHTLTGVLFYIRMLYSADFGSVSTPLGKPASQPASQQARQRPKPTPTKTPKAQNNAQPWDKSSRKKRGGPLTRSSHKYQSCCRAKRENTC